MKRVTRIRRARMERILWGPKIFIVPALPDWVYKPAYYRSWAR